MIQENRRLWKLLLFTIPTFGIYNIYFWFRFTQDLNEMNQKEKRIKNYILVWFLSILTLGIYRWVWLFYIEDRLQMTGEDLGIKVHPGPGTTLALWTFGKFILIGPFLADFFLIHNINKVAKAYNASLLKKTKALSKKQSLTDEKKTIKKAGSNEKTITKTTASTAKTVTGNVAKTTAAAGTTGAATMKTASQTTKPVTIPKTVSPARTSTGTSKTTGSSTKKPVENKPKVVNKQVITPEKKPSAATSNAEIKKATGSTKPAQKTGSRPEPPKSSTTQTKPVTKTDAKKEVAATKEPAAKTNPSTVTLDVEKNRPRTSDATLTINPGLTNMPTGKK